MTRITFWVRRRDHGGLVVPFDFDLDVPDHLLETADA